MKKLRLVIFVLALLLGALFTTASSSWHGGEAVAIFPGSGEVTMKQGQMVRAYLYREGGGWGSCSRGMDLDYKEAAIAHLELWRGNRLIQVINKRDGRWDTTKGNPDWPCVHVDSPYLSNWHFDYLWFYLPGDYELRFTRGISAPLSDGADFDPIDGFPDLYNPGSNDYTVVIHVEAWDWH